MRFPMNSPAPQNSSATESASFFERARNNMVEQQIRTWEVLDQDVLDLLYVVPREDFVPPRHRALALSDLEIPIGDGEKMWQPKLEARVLQELALHKTDRVLEVGTGSGYLTALLAHRAGHIHSVEINPRLAAFGKANLSRYALDNVTLAIGDAAHGWERDAPYDIIVLTGSTPVLPRSLLAQLAPAGRLFAVVGEAPAMGAQVVTCTAPGAYGAVTLFETVLKPLVNAEHPSRFRF
jgi:protein-L-isoaspartate(D-aspartate) O-methyltransferase